MMLKYSQLPKSSVR